MESSGIITQTKEVGSEIGKDGCRRLNGTPEAGEFLPYGDPSPEYLSDSSS